MIQMLQDFFRPVADETILTNLRRRFMLALDVAGLVLALIVLIYDLVNSGIVDPIIVGLLGVALLIQVLAYFRFIDLPATLMVVTLIYAALTFETMLMLPALLAVMAAAALMGRWRYWLVNVVVLGAQVSLLIQRAGESQGASLFDFAGDFGLLIALVIVSLSIRFFIIVMETAVNDQRRNAELLKTTTEVGQFATNILDLQELFNRSVDLIQRRFGFYHVQVFMVQDNQAELVASTGSAGQKLLANRHRLEIGSNSVIGRVTRYGELVITRDTDSDAAYFRNPLLPETRAEMAVPIFEGEKVVGALDLQSTQRDAFQQADVEALQSLANLLASAIRNARLFEQQNRSVKEQQRLYLESESNLREIQRLNRQLTKEGWSDYVEQSQGAAGLTLHNNQITAQADWTENLLAAAQQRQPITRAANGHPGVVAVPVMLRGEVIGAIEVEPDADTDETVSVEMVRAIAERLATSLENARLYEEAQAATAQEQRINHIVSRFQTAATIDDLLQITLTELTETLGARRGAIRLGIIPDAPEGGSQS